jgi:hypothetical protein
MAAALSVEAMVSGRLPTRFELSPLSLPSVRRWKSLLKGSGCGCRQTSKPPVVARSRRRHREAEGPPIDD